jgi:hypothetical protein
MTIVRSFLWQIILIIGFLNSSSCLAESNNDIGQIAENLAGLKRCLQSLDTDKETRFKAEVEKVSDTNAQHAVVYLRGRKWCGSGGCTLLMLEKHGDDWKVISKIPVVHLPIRILNKKHNGWHDLSVRVGGGGITESYDVDLHFDGKKFSKDPSSNHPKKLDLTEPGESVITDELTEYLINE